MLKQQNNKLAVILFTTFLNTMGIGILIPVFAFIVSQYTGGNATTETMQNTAITVGLISSCYAFCEFLVAPTLGVLSDKYGRKPVLVFSMVGSIVGYLLLGIGGSLWILFLGRIIDGLSAGNISTIFAYVGDISTDKSRNKNYGLVGATLGFGFLFGPALGGFLAGFSYSLPMFMSASLCFINLIWIYFGLEESHKIENRGNKLTDKIKFQDINPIGVFWDIGTNAFLKTILVASSFHFLAFAQLQGNGSVLFKDVLGWNPFEIGIAFFVIGSVNIAMQGFLTDKLSKKFGEKKMIIFGLIATIFAYLLWALLPITGSVWLTYFGLVVFSFGTGLFEPNMASLVSWSGGRENQGKSQGSYQSLQSLSRVIGPVLAGALYGFNNSFPYLLSAIIVCISVYLFSKVNLSKPSSKPL